MEISIKTENNIHILEISGSVNSIVESQKIKNEILQINKHDIVLLDFKDAVALPSTLIGYLIKATKIDLKKISILSANSELTLLLDRLGLKQLLQKTYR